MQALQALEHAFGDGWAATGASTANTAGTLAKAAVSGKCHYITGFSVVVTAAAAAATAAGFLIQLKDGATSKWEETLPASAAVGTRIAVTFPTPIMITSGAAASLAVAALGESSIARMNLAGYTI